MINSYKLSKNLPYRLLFNPLLGTVPIYDSCSVIVIVYCKNYRYNFSDNDVVEIKSDSDVEHLIELDR